MKMFKKSLWVIIFFTMLDIVMVSCNKKGTQEVCDTILTAAILNNVSIGPGLIYPSTTYDIGNETVDRSTYAMEIILQDSVKECHKISSIAPLFINTAYANKTLVNAKTADRLSKVYMIANTDYNTTVKKGDTINSIINFSTYLLNHRFDNIDVNNFIPQFNALLSNGSTEEYYAGDYLPKVYIHLTQAAQTSAAVSFKILIQLENGRIITGESKPVFLQN
jgi:hypothetical protein